MRSFLIIFSRPDVWPVLALLCAGHPKFDSTGYPRTLWPGVAWKLSMRRWRLCWLEIWSFARGDTEYSCCWVLSNPHWSFGILLLSFFNLLVWVDSMWPAKWHHPHFRIHALIDLIYFLVLQILSILPPATATADISRIQKVLSTRFQYSFQ